jgi:hypothetical protein
LSSTTMLIAKDGQSFTHKQHPVHFSGFQCKSPRIRTGVGVRTYGYLSVTGRLMSD